MYFSRNLSESEGLHRVDWCCDSNVRVDRFGQISLG